MPYREGMTFTTFVSMRLELGKYTQIIFNITHL